MGQNSIDKLWPLKAKLVTQHFGKFIKNNPGLTWGDIVFGYREDDDSSSCKDNTPGSVKGDCYGGTIDFWFYGQERIFRLWYKYSYKTKELIHEVSLVETGKSDRV